MNSVQRFHRSRICRSVTGLLSTQPVRMRRQAMGTLHCVKYIICRVGLMRRTRTMIATTDPLYMEYLSYGMPFLWNALPMECSSYGMPLLWNALLWNVLTIGMPFLWNVLTMECPSYGMFLLWNVLPMECPYYEMSFLWNALLFSLPLTIISGSRPTAVPSSEPCWYRY